MIIYFVFVKISYTLLYHELWNHHKMAKKYSEGNGGVNLEEKNH